MESSHHQFLKPFLPADDHRFEFELYTIPGSSGWFSWDNIHEIEKSSLKEFFDGTSFTRNPRVYKEYRDFIISKYREDPSRRLTFSEVRKSLVGDVNYLLKVFLFLQNWGLINFSAPSPSSASGDEDSDLVKEEDEEGRWKVKVEEGPPHGVRVVAIPNSLKPVSLPALSSSNGSHLAESDFKMPPLSSHSDVYQELIESVCGNCKELCDSGHYEYTKDKSSIICVKCFKNGSFGNNKSSDDYTFLDSIPEKKSHVAAWTEAETLLLLESVLKHGDDWDLVAQNVETKSKQDCISKLIQLPFGQLMLGPTYDRFRHRDTSNISNNQKQEQENPPPPPPPQETKDVEPPESKIEQNGDADSEEPPPKRICIEPISDSSNSKMEKINNEDEQVAPQLLVSEEISEKEDKPCEAKNQKQQDKDLEVEDNCFLKTNCSKSVPNVTSSLMQQVSRISVVVGPMVAASAAEAAVTALCEENEIPKEMFDSEENGNELQINESERISQGNDSEMDIQPHESEKGLIPLALRMRATSATALGAAAAHAKLLAIQEDKQIERLVSTVIKTQLKKLQYKMELLKQVEGIMEKEFTQIAEVEELLVTERMDVVQKAIDGGVSRWRDRTVVKSQVEIIL